MALFGNNYDRGFGNRGGAQGQNRGMMGSAGEGLRQGWDRLENGVRNAMDRTHHDPHEGGWQGGAQGGNAGWGRNASYGGSGYGQGMGDRDHGGRDLGDRGFGNTGYTAGGYGSGMTGGAGYGRDFGRGHGAQGQGGMGGSMRAGWNRVENGARDAFDVGGYDRDYGGRHNSGGGMMGGMSGEGMMGGAGRGAGYDRNFGGMSRGHGGMDYDRSNTGSTGYDRDMKSRSQTDAGDPFGDRASHTPIRMLRGPYRGAMGSDYDRQYKEGVGNDPYHNTNDPSSGGMYRGSGSYDRNFRDRNDRGWF